MKSWNPSDSTASWGIAQFATKRCCICDSCPFDFTASTKTFGSSPDASASRYDSEIAAQFT
jgi:hypothetical protein